MDTYKNNWEESYSRGENHIFYPKEQCVKFLSRYVGQRVDSSMINYKAEYYNGARALDFGCGIGTQTKLMTDFGLDAIGVDISVTAINSAKSCYPSLQDNFRVIAGDGYLDFEDNYFRVSMAESVLDSMHFELAKKSIKTLDRVTHGFVFISLIGAKLRGNHSTEDVVSTQHEYGTIQSYFDQGKVELLLRETNLKIVSQYTITDFDDKRGTENDVRTYLVLSNI